MIFFSWTSLISGNALPNWISGSMSRHTALKSLCCFACHEKYHNCYNRLLQEFASSFQCRLVYAHWCGSKMWYYRSSFGLRFQQEPKYLKHPPTPPHLLQPVHTSAVSLRSLESVMTTTVPFRLSMSWFFTLIQAIMIISAGLTGLLRGNGKLASIIPAV